METNKATQQQFVTIEQFNTIITEYEKLKQNERDNKIFEAINKVNESVKNLDNKIEGVKKDVEDVKKNAVTKEILQEKLNVINLNIDNVKLSNRIWVIGGTLTTLIGIIIAVFIAFAKHWVGV